MVQSGSKGRQRVQSGSEKVRGTGQGPSQGLRETEGPDRILVDQKDQSGSEVVRGSNQV